MRLILGGGSGLDGMTGARNMALDHALFESVQRSGRPVLRLYGWSPPCLSLGRNQHAAGLYDEARAAAAGVDIVRRPTGGLAVLHDRELTYCVLAPLAPFGGARAAYAAINRALVHGLRLLGVPAALAATQERIDPRAHAARPCFDRPAAGEVIAGGRKLVGSAQRCERRTLLQHGSILLDGSQSAMFDLLADAPAPAFRPPAAGPATTVPAAGAVTLAELLGATPGTMLVAEAIRAGFEAGFGTSLAPATLSRDEIARARELEACYDAVAWTWRR